MSLNHFGHQHPLKLSIKKLRSKAKCKACEKYCDGPTYSCETCRYNLEKSCAELPMCLQIPYHPHPLTLASTKDTRRPRIFLCVACLQYRDGFAFFCDRCDFILDVECALRRPEIDEGQEQLQHFAHLHPLVVIERNDEGNSGYCVICGKCSSDKLYSCEPCNFHVHQSCTGLQLPRMVQPIYHPTSLTLCIRRTEYECGACGSISQGSYYHCKQCDFKFEINCALFQNDMESHVQRQFHHSIHEHPMTLAEIKLDEEIPCSACTKRCSGQTYVCCKSQCKLTLHSSCFDLPPKIHHPLHCRHHLTLTKKDEFKICNACRNYVRGFFYYCHHCDFSLDVECPVTMSTIKYQGHHHDLLFIEKMGEGFDWEECRACGGPLQSSSSVFHCTECDFNLHLECGPLPDNIQDENHLVHPLAIIYSPVLIEGEDKHTLFYCDACEKERDPRLPIYYCSNGCPYIAELKCVISEVMSSLRGERGQVDLRTAIRQIAGKVIGKGIVNKGIEVEEQGQGCSTEIASNIKLEESTVEPDKTFSEVCASLTNKERNYLKKSLKNAQRKISYMEMTRSLSKDEESDYKPVNFWENDTVVKVGDHLVTQGFAPILADLVAKYGDISTKCDFESPNLKMYFFVKLCGVINKMCHTRVVDLSEGELECWWKYLVLVSIAGFDVQFVLDHLQRVTKAYKGLQYVKEKQGYLENIKEQITNYPQDIEKLEAELADKTRSLKELNERRERVLSTKPMYSSSYETECLKEASLLKWMRAGEGLL